MNKSLKLHMMNFLVSICLIMLVSTYGQGVVGVVCVVLICIANTVISRIIDKKHPKEKIVWNKRTKAITILLAFIVIVSIILGIVLAIVLVRG